MPGSSQGNWQMSVYPAVLRSNTVIIDLSAGSTAQPINASRSPLRIVDRRRGTGEERRREFDFTNERRDHRDRNEPRQVQWTLCRTANEKLMKDG
ncbi:hypothetical protein WMY93_003925 [Mugilogobius chulae]|uniref:Uncharacterized protein n=1 Tax=Mugilogobius chulae TaxID=88201 RepID=A0AAW0Q0V5_9GOBI